MPLGLEILKQLRPEDRPSLRCSPDGRGQRFFIEQFARIGVQMISVHAESAIHLDRTLSQIKEEFKRVALNQRPSLALDYVLDKLDFVMLMTVNPGYAGQKLRGIDFGKDRSNAEFLDETGRLIPIEVDGNVSFENIPKMVGAGADILVAGTSSLFHPAASLRNNLMKTNESIAVGLASRDQKS
jgi:ribulose-phosphate 3-epimerase